MLADRGGLIVTPTELTSLAALHQLAEVEGINPASARLCREYLEVSGLVAIPIEAVSSFMGRGDDIELQDKSGAAVGTICFTRSLQPVSPGGLTRWQYVAFLADCELAQLGLEYTFRRDYVVVDEPFAEDYLDNYAAGAPLWGGYTHSPLPQREQGPIPTKIVGNPDICLPTSFHEQTLTRYVEATNAFDRFLKLYHTLELLFDYVVLKQMRRVGDNLQQFGTIMQDYKRPEIDRLKFLLHSFCGDPNIIAEGFGPVSLHRTIAEEIFQNHTKDGNPIKEHQRWVDLMDLAQASTLAETDFRKKKLVSQNHSYAAFVTGLAAYWIYRVRSSIAHSRVGEFLFTDNDEKFITEFAEPLLLDVVNQVFENVELKQLGSA